MTDNFLLPAEFAGLDLLATAHYYDGARGFFNAQQPLVLWLYDWTPWLGRALLVVMALPRFEHPAFWAPYALVGEGGR